MNTHTRNAQDVTTFLAWAAQPEMDERKLMGIKGLTIIGALRVCVCVGGQWVAQCWLACTACCQAVR